MPFMGVPPRAMSCARKNVSENCQNEQRNEIESSKIREGMRKVKRELTEKKYKKQQSHIKQKKTSKKEVSRKVVAQLGEVEGHGKSRSVAASPSDARRTLLNQNDACKALVEVPQVDRRDTALKVATGREANGGRRPKRRTGLGRCQRRGSPESLPRAACPTARHRPAGADRSGWTRAT